MHESCIGATHNTGMGVRRRRTMVGVCEWVLWWGATMYWHGAHCRVISGGRRITMWCVWG